MFLPAFLLVAGALPFWEALRQRGGVQRAMAGVNAAVVGVLVAALYDPVWTSAIHSKADFGLALAAFGLLVSIVVENPLVPIVFGLVGGIIFGVISTTIPYAATRGQRDFASTMQLVAGRYDVLCDPRSAEKARDMLARLTI